MNFDFPLILIALTLIFGLIALVDILFWAKKRKAVGAKKPVVVDYARSLFPVILLVLLLRSFVAQMYYVPTGSLKPTVIPGDLLLITEYSYGLRMPVWRNKILNVGKPKVGEIMVVKWPVNPAVHFVKRVIGVPGDRISYINKVLYINGKEAKQKFIGYGTDSNSLGKWSVKKMQEDLDGVKHDIYLCYAKSKGCPGIKAHNFYNLVVPKGEYFLMGDNRDNSDDSRDWGFVSKNELVGKGQYILINIFKRTIHGIFGQFGTKL